MSLRIAPIYYADSNDCVRRWHRHNKPTLGAIFCVSVKDDADDVRGVAIAGRPVARHFDDGATLEILRVATDGERNACSMLYAACRKIGRAMGYTKIITYSLPEEGGASLRAAGYLFDGEAGGSGAMWGTRQGRAAEQIGDDLVGGKWRWIA